MLLNDNTGGEVVVLRLISIQCAKICISAVLPFI